MLRRIKDEVLSVLLTLVVILLFIIGVIIVSPFMLVHYIKRKLKGDNHD